MRKDYSPLAPGRPAVVQFFVGRAEQIAACADWIAAISFVGGERGLDKASLASFVRAAMSGEGVSSGSAHTLEASENNVPRTSVGAGRAGLL